MCDITCGAWYAWSHTSYPYTTTVALVSEEPEEDVNDDDGDNDQGDEEAENGKKGGSNS